MAGVMAPITQITLLITFSAISQCDSVSAETGSLDNTVLLNKYGVQREGVKRNALLCWMCQVTVHEVISLAVRDLKKEVKAICKKFKNFENSCRKQAYKYEAMAIRLFFHGTDSEDVCRHMKMCE